MTGATTELPDGLKAVAAELTNKYSRQLPREVVEATVEQIWADISSEARFTTYLPVLTRRAAEQRLRMQLA